MTECISCGESLPATKSKGRPRRWCSDACRMRARRIGSGEKKGETPCSEIPVREDTPIVTEPQAASGESYTAANIKVLSEDDQVDLFIWVKAADLATKYPATSPVFISRLLQVCESTGFPKDLAIRRYLDKDVSVQIPDYVKREHLDATLRFHRGLEYIEADKS